MPTIPTDPKERRRFFVILGVLGICLAWLLYYIPTHLDFRHPAVAPTTSGSTVAKQINEKLLADHKYPDVAVAVVSENPMRFAVSGGVYSKVDLDALPDFLKGINPEPEYDLSNVIIIKR